MANYKKKTTTSVQSSTANVVERVAETPKVQPKKFAQDELISCKSITAGELLMVGEKSKMLYRWADAEDVQDVEYQDLIYATRSNSGFVFKPRFIVMDEEFLAQNPKVQELYDNMYTIKDLKDILLLSPNEMRRVINTLPDGAKDSLKNMASTMIDNGSLDSVARIKVLDELFNTSLMLKTELL